MNENNLKVAFEKMVSLYCNNLSKSDKKLIPELEVRFYSNRENILTKMDYDNVVRQLYKSEFTTKNEDGQHLLRITPEQNTTNQSNTNQLSRIRIELIGLSTIKSYCENKEDLNELLKCQQILTSSTPINLIKFTNKSKLLLDDKNVVEDIKFGDFCFNVSYKNESHSTPYEDANQYILSKWNETKKTFRYMNRIKFEHNEYPITADISIVRSSKIKNKKQMNEYTLENVIGNNNTYEIEIEIDNVRAKQYSSKELISKLRKVIRIILCGLHQSNYPIGCIETKMVLQSYMLIINGKKYNKNKIIETKDFIGPNCLTLQIENIIEKSQINIHTNYCVTDKADGVRSLLYISDNGRLYLIDTTMSIIFTGMILDTNEKMFYKSILDGEYILFNKYGKAIHLFAAFDIYYMESLYIGNLPFENINKKGKGRFTLLKTFIEKLKFKSIVKESTSINFQIKCKSFQFTSSTQSIYMASNLILSSSLLDEYNKDGLIFTPFHIGVCDENDEPLTRKKTWKTSFKWKPLQHNTIDFLVKIKKDEKGVDEVHNIFIQGSVDSVIQYKTIELLCGFSHVNDGYMNPMMELLEGKFYQANEMNTDYKPMKFFPTNPSDQNACYCNIVYKDNLLKTEDGHCFDEDMIIEFRYDVNRVGLTNDNAWKWIPVRIRYDKMRENTQMILNEKIKPNYGNSYLVANTNWNSIHYPITENMITTGLNIPTILIDNTLYYKKNNEPTITRALRDFHNMYVKRQLIQGVSSSTNKHKTLIDFAVGKGGDLHKWIEAKLSFVLGIDIKKDNIENKIDGACARYLNELKKYQTDPKFLKAMFIVGDSSKNIRDNSSYSDNPGSIDEQISNAVFGVGLNDEKSLLKTIYQQYKIAYEGFDISSIQFSLHYFFKDKDTVHQFMRNVCECTRIGGYFIGTCYDGKEIFQKLEKNVNAKWTIMTKDKKYKMMEITKLYHETNFPEEESCLGYAIDVWQESINQNFNEYLVNFTYLQKLMTNYGFALITQEEATEMKLPNSSGLFIELYNMMLKNNKNSTNYGKAYEMKEEEKLISFLNRYFVFKKVKAVDSKQIQRIMKDEMIVNTEDTEINIHSNVVKTSNKITIDESSDLPKFKIKVNGVPIIGKQVTIKKKETIFVLEEEDKKKKGKEKEKKVVIEKEKKVVIEKEKKVVIEKEKKVEKEKGVEKEKEKGVEKEKEKGVEKEKEKGVDRKSVV